MQEFYLFTAKVIENIHLLVIMTANMALCRETCKEYLQVQECIHAKTEKSEK